MISVVIPCHDNHAALPFILQALRNAEVFDLEIVCVDDASDQSLLSIAEEFDARLIRLEGTPGRRALARQRGHEASSGSLTLYLDGDVIPDPRLLAVALKEHADPTPVVVKYPVYSIPQAYVATYLEPLAKLILEGDRVLLGRVVRPRVSLDTRPLPRSLYGKKTTLWQLCASHCVSMPRDLVEGVGGWDPSFVGWGEEDIELAYRLYLAGARFVYPHPRMVSAYHLDHSVDWSENFPALLSNIRRFRNKFPESWPSREPFLRWYFNESGQPQALAKVVGS